jgi:hypothetical protein
MIRHTALAMLLALSASAQAAPGGLIATLQVGTYACELPGDAAGPAGIRQPERDFAIVNATTYTSGTGRGSYLLTGTTLLLTSGPRKGERFVKLSENFLRQLDSSGKPTDLRCIRQVVNNS